MKNNQQTAIHQYANNGREDYLNSQVLNDMYHERSNMLQNLEEMKIPNVQVNTEKDAISAHISRFNKSMNTIKTQDAGVKIYPFGTILPKQEFTEKFKNINFVATDKTIDIVSINRSVGGDVLSGFYDKPVYTRKPGVDDIKTAKYESMAPFEVTILVDGNVSASEFFIIETSNGLVYSKNSRITIKSYKEVVSVSDYNFVWSSGSSVVNPVYAYGVMNKSINIDGSIVVGNAFRKCEIQTVDILNVYIGESSTSFPLTETKKMNFGKSYKKSTISLSGDTMLLGATIKFEGQLLDVETMIENSNSDISVEITYADINSLIDGLSIVARRLK